MKISVETVCRFVEVVMSEPVLARCTVLASSPGFPLCACNYCKVQW